MTVEAVQQAPVIDYARGDLSKLPDEALLARLKEIGTHHIRYNSYTTQQVTEFRNIGKALVERGYESTWEGLL